MEIADSRPFDDLNQVTAARSDLSASMGLIPDDEEVMRVTKNIVYLSRERGKKLPLVERSLNPISEKSPKPSDRI